MINIRYGGNVSYVQDTYELATVNLELPCFKVMVYTEQLETITKQIIPNGHHIEIDYVNNCIHVYDTVQTKLSSIYVNSDINYMVTFEYFDKDGLKMIISPTQLLRKDDLGWTL